MNVQAPTPPGGEPPDGPGGGPRRILIVIYGEELGRRHDIDGERTTIGRAPDSTIVIDQPGVSRTHAELLVDERGLRVRDCDSRNGTFVDNKRITETELHSGDQLRISGTIFKLLEGDNIDTDYNEELFRLSSVDGLTALYNRRSFVEAVEREIENAKTTGTPLGFIVLDVEGMTSLNEIYGHEAGDQILRGIAGRVRTHVRPSDGVGRIGGDEFAIVLPRTDRDTCIQMAHELHDLISRERFNVGSREVHAEVALGCAALGSQTGSYERLLEHARRELNEIRRARITSTFEEES